jgi:hypothetical protein
MARECQMEALRALDQARKRSPLDRVFSGKRGDRLRAGIAALKWAEGISFLLSEAVRLEGIAVAVAGEDHQAYERADAAIRSDVESAIWPRRRFSQWLASARNFFYRPSFPWQEKRRPKRARSPGQQGELEQMILEARLAELQAFDFVKRPQDGRHRPKEAQSTLAAIRAGVIPSVFAEAFARTASEDVDSGLVDPLRRAVALESRAQELARTHRLSLANANAYAREEVARVGLRSAIDRALDRHVSVPAVVAAANQPGATEFVDNALLYVDGLAAGTPFGGRRFGVYFTLQAIIGPLNDPADQRTHRVVFAGGGAMEMRYGRDGELHPSLSLRGNPLGLFTTVRAEVLQRSALYSNSMHEHDGGEEEDVVE